MKFIQISKNRLFKVYDSITGMTTVKGCKPLINIFIKMLIPVGARLSPNWVRTIVYFLQNVYRIRRKSGLVFLTKYLKGNSVILQQAIGGYIIPDTGALSSRISRTQGGLPRLIPSYHRKLIRLGDPVVIKFWLTLFSLFRDLQWEGLVKTKTITDPSKETSRSHMVLDHLDAFIKHFRLSEDIQLERSSPFWIWKSAPGAMSRSGTYSTNPVVIMMSHAYLRKDPKLFSAWTYLCKFQSGSDNRVWKLFTTIYTLGYYKPWKTFHLGKLGTKNEAAGKVRVFAMVDPWTQWVLRPLHRWIFLQLRRRFPTDGTFDQLRPLKRIKWGFEELYSLDLSAATDRLPIWLQQSLLSKIFGSQFASSWRCLLVDRLYTLKGVTPLKYTVGQPMGALSSWAMLALTHHYIVIYSAILVYGKKRGLSFTRYSLLGDDVTIFDRKVAMRYIHVMSTLGVELGIAKSILSRRGLALEFAKRTFFKGKDVSPTPLKELSASLTSVAAMAQYAIKYKLSLLQVYRLFGYGYRTNSKTLNSRTRTIMLQMVLPKGGSELRSLLSPMAASDPLSEQSLRYAEFLLRTFTDMLKQLEDYRWLVGAYGLGKFKPSSASYWEGYYYAHPAHNERALVGPQGVLVNELDFEKPILGPWSWAQQMKRFMSIAFPFWEDYKKHKFSTSLPKLGMRDKGISYIIENNPIVPIKDARRHSWSTFQSRLQYVFVREAGIKKLNLAVIYDALVSDLFNKERRTVSSIIMSMKTHFRSLSHPEHFMHVHQWCELLDDCAEDWFSAQEFIAASNVTRFLKLFSRREMRKLISEDEQISFRSVGVLPTTALKFDNLVKDIRKDDTIFNTIQNQLR